MSVATPIATTATSACAACFTLQADLEVPLKRCGQCKAVLYCSRDCQVGAWPAHKAECKALRTGAAQPAPPPPKASNLLGDLLEKQSRDTPPNAHLSSLPQADAIRQLIDAYRLRVEDEYSFNGEACGLYGGEDPNPGFMDYLHMAEERKILPDWWSKKKRRQVVAVANDTQGNSCIHHAVEKSDISEAYGDGMMPMVLRNLATRIYGEPVNSFANFGW